MTDFTRQRFPALALGLTLAVVAGCGNSQAEENGNRVGGPMAAGGTAERMIPVGVEVVAPTDLQVTLRGSTNLRARQQVEILPKQGGVIDRILVEEGAMVRQGQPLAVLDDEEWRLQARQSAARAQASRDALERGLALQERGLLADQEVERLRSDAEVSAADAALAELRVRNAQIVAPMAGVVSHRNVERGQLVGASTVAFVVADVSRLEADVGIPEREAPRVRVGQQARIRAEGSGAGVVGRVSRIRPVVDPGSGTVQVTVEVEPGEGAALRAGQFVNVDLVTEVLENRLALPRTAVLVDGPTPRVYRVFSGWAEEVEVELGANQGERVEIRSGLQAGDTVVVLGQDNLRTGAPVLVMEVNGAALELAPEDYVQQAPRNREEIEARLVERGMSPEEARRTADQMLNQAGGGPGGPPGGMRPGGLPGGGGGTFGGGGMRGGRP
jgi:membrane fusion protein, multidrug efflux system